MSKSVIMELARRMVGRTDKSWSAAVVAVVRERIVDPLAFRLETARIGLEGAKWLYEEEIEPSQDVYEIVMDDIIAAGEAPFHDDVPTDPGGLTLDELIDRLSQMRRENPRLGSQMVMAARLPELFHGIVGVRYGANREIPIDPEHYSLMLVLQ